ncbi:MAG: hypothetical protein AUH31_03380 [Armatimonadetes bacterium 13_1_40CM_64_14]|nr:MAG: hypothetical protein AUH31_03380 [Armatimonadetes bacterium 13_1_40CM_64_14]
MDIRRVLVGGIVASFVMGIIEMISEAVAGSGFWAPMVYMGATVLRGLQAVQAPVAFTFWGVVLGLMGHMMNSIILSFIFLALFARGSQARGTLITSGAAYGLAVFVMWYLVVPAIDPVLRQLNAPVFAVAHIMWGAALGLLASAGAEPALQVKTKTASA